MENLDQDVVNIAKAIRQSESGGDFKAKGKSGEYGGYQFTPDTWNAQASKYGINVPIEKATREQQNEVAYKQIKEWKDSGKNVGQVASMWNAGQGEPDAYTGKFSNGKPSIGVNKFGVKYDVPSYAKSVATAYQTIKNGGQVNSDSNNPSSVKPDLTKDTIINPPAENPTNEELKVKSSPVTDLIPGFKLAQGAGYGLSGNQKGLIEANDRSIDIQGQLIKQIKDNKAKGKDTARLEKALKDLGMDIEENAGKVSDLGTGGITNKQVKKSAGSLAALPVAAYGATVLGGGGLSGTARGLTSGKLGTQVPRAFNSPAVKEVIQLGKGETIGSLSRKELMTGLENALKEMKVSQIGTSYEKEILKAIKALSPELKQSLLKRFSKGVASEATRFVLYNALGEGAGKVVEKFIP